jgi:hypothetical protein
VERRRESRFEANKPVLVTTLGLLGMPPVTGRAIDMSGSGLRVLVPNPMPLGSTVKVETDHLVMKGEVRRCEDGPKGFVVGVHLSDIASGNKPGHRVIIER